MILPIANPNTVSFVALFFVLTSMSPAKAVPTRPLFVTGDTKVQESDGDGSIRIEGELKKWHKVTFSQSGPFARETDLAPNPFRDYRFQVTFTHESGAPTYVVPGYFAADGEASESSAESGNTWRCHFSPDKVGTWNYVVDFQQGRNAAISTDLATPVIDCHLKAGSFQIRQSDKTGNDFRARGRLGYSGTHFLIHAESKQAFFKVGPDSPETLLAFDEFDGTRSLSLNKSPVKSWQPHVKDWRENDPVWKGGKGKGLIGALNYLSHKGLNSFSFLTYNVDGDGNNVWPFVSATQKLHFDCSKLDQWQIVFDHAQSLGLLLHFKLQETENDDNRVGNQQATKRVAASLDGGELGVERKLYLRELIARFGYGLGVEWNLGEENTQSTKQQKEMISYMRSADPYQHNVVVHTYPDQQDKKYNPLLGATSGLTGVSLQNRWDRTHRRTLHWVNESARFKHPWVVCNDEQGMANQGVPPDAGFMGFSGFVEMADGRRYDANDIRKQTLWGNLMAGGAGVMYYFGYQLPENDLKAEDFRSRDKSWDYCRIARAFVEDNEIPLDKLKNQNRLVGNHDDRFGPWCLGNKDQLFLIYFPTANTVSFDLTHLNGEVDAYWFNPRVGGAVMRAEQTQRKGDVLYIKTPESKPTDDWVFLMRKK